MAHDLFTRNGILVDATGTPGKRGNLTAAGRRVAAIGTVDGKGKREIDADGKAVTPGFVDIHTHLDAQTAWDSASPCCRHGVTSVISSTAASPLPQQTEGRGHLAEMMESVEGVSQRCISAGLSCDWETFGEYLAPIGRMQKGVNLDGTGGHYAVRTHVLGQRWLG